MFWFCFTLLSALLAVLAYIETTKLDEGASSSSVRYKLFAWGILVFALPLVVGFLFLGGRELSQVEEPGLLDDACCYVFLLVAFISAGKAKGYLDYLNKQSGTHKF